MATRTYYLMRDLVEKAQDLEASLEAAINILWQFHQEPVFKKDKKLIEDKIEHLQQIQSELLVLY